MMRGSNGLTCKATRALASDFIDGALSESDQRRYSHHLLTCSACADLTNDLRTVVAMLHGVRDRPPADRDFASLLAARRDWFDDRRKNFTAPGRVAATVQRSPVVDILCPDVARSVAPSAGERPQLLSPDTAYDLVAQAFQSVFRDPALAIRTAEQAVAIAQALRRTNPDANDLLSLHARALACLANSLRVAGQYDRAEAAFAPAEEMLASGQLDTGTLGEILRLKATLQAQRGRVAVALPLFDLAADYSLSANEQRAYAKALIAKGTYLSDAGKPNEALLTLQAGLAAADAVGDTQLVLVAKHNLVHTRQELGDLERATAELKEVQRRHRENAEPVTAARLVWLEALVARESGDLDRAEDALRDVRTRFLSLGLPYDAALAALDLAIVYVRKGRSDRVSALILELTAALRDKELVKDVVETLLFLRQSAKGGSITVALVAGAIAAVRQRMSRT